MREKPPRLALISHFHLPFGDDPEMGFIGSKNYVPHVIKCEFCPTNEENVLASFDDLSKCQIDKHPKHGVLTHTTGEIADGSDTTL